MRPSDIRKRILKQRGVELKRLSRKPISVDQLPSPYPKSRLMQLIELRHGRRLDELIFTGTIYDAAKRLGIDATTVSKWRTLINKTKDKAFFDSFL